MAKELISTDPTEISKFWGRDVLPFLAPIVEADYKQEPVPIGSAVVVGLQEQQYILTANHVIAAHAAGTAKGAYYTYLPERTELVGDVISVGEPYDLALVELRESAKRWLKMPQILTPDVREDEICLFVGFQARAKSWHFDATRNALRTPPLSYLGRVLKPSEEQFSIRFNQKQIERHGIKHRNVGKLNGISGTGVFVLRDDRPRLAGIVIEYHARRSEIVCTSALVIRELLKQL